MNASDIAKKAADLVSGDRAQAHGDMADNFGRCADLWSAYLGKRLDVELTAVDVGNMMALLKIARTQTGEVNADDFVDGAGYLACAGEIALKQYRR
ncbi:DUF6378 domain-containing protein [Bradyrhizobium sp. 930_D9_N1_4]|uniref:DUF6378 domain-containing protein n=1 Tax=Bradyrhizobium sp. 930_D9_N1_4 TaxID=3240374 RepID=UPI003F8BDA33